MMENKKMRAEHPKKELAVDILYDIIGSILFGAGIYTFAEGGNFAPGGISGIALIMNKLWNLPVGTMTFMPAILTRTTSARWRRWQGIFRWSSSVTRQ